MAMRRLFGVLIFSFLIWALGCSSLTIYTDFDRNLDFAQYRSYVWAGQDSIPEELLVRTPRLREMIHFAADKELEARGFQKVDSPGKADLKLSVRFLVQRKKEIEDMGGRAKYDPEWMPSDDTEIVVDEYDEGTLVLSFVDVKSNRMVWRGWAVRRMMFFRKPERTQREVEFTISQILSKFPPGK